MLLLLLAAQDAFVSEKDASLVREWIEAGRWEALVGAYDAAPEGPLRTFMTIEIAAHALEPYRVLAGGPADDPAETARRYFLTAAGFEASHRWANGLVDEGRTAEAADVLERVMRYHPDADALTAARLLQLRKDADGLAVAKALAARVNGVVIVNGEEIELARFAESLPSPEAKTAPVGILMDGEPNGYITIEKRLWKHDFRAIDKSVVGIPAILDCDGSTLVVASDGAEIVAIEAGSGRLWWRVEAGDTADAGPFNPPLPTVGATVDGDRLFAPVGLSTRRRASAPVRCVCELVCLETRTGTGIWKAEPPYEGADWTYAAPPIVRDGRLYSGVTAFGESHRETAVVCHDRETGKLLWNRRLCRHRDRHWMSPHPLVSLAIDGDRLIAANNDGEVVALHPDTGAVEWAAFYETKRSFARDPSPVQIRNGMIYILPQDQPELKVFALADGAPQPTARIERAYRKDGWRWYQSILGFCDGKLVAQGIAKSLAVDLERERTYDIYGTSTAPTGRGAIGGRYIYLPIHEDERRMMAVFEAGSWKYRYSERWHDPDEGGNLAVRGPLLVAQGTVVSAYGELPTSIEGREFDLDAVWTAARVTGDPVLTSWFLHLAEHRPSQAARVAALERGVRD